MQPTAIDFFPARAIRAVGSVREKEKRERWTYVGDQLLEYLPAAAALFGRAVRGKVFDEVDVVVFCELGAVSRRRCRRGGLSHGWKTGIRRVRSASVTRLLCFSHSPRFV